MGKPCNIKIGDIKYTWVVENIIVKQNGRTYLECECICGCNEKYTVRIDGFNNHCKKLCKKQKEILRNNKNDGHISREEYKTRLIGKIFGNLNEISENPIGFRRWDVSETY